MHSIPCAAACAFLILMSQPSTAQDIWQRLDGPYEGNVLSVALDSAGRLFAATSWEIYRSDDTGRSFQALARPTIPATTIDLWTTPSGGLLALIDSALTARLIRTADGGTTWSPSDSGLPTFYTRGNACFGSDAENRVVYLGLEDGVFRSSDDGVSWRKLIALKASALSAIDGGVFAIVSGTLYRLDPATGYDTVRVPVLDGRQVVSVLAEESDVFWVSTTRAGSSPGSVFRTTDGGATWVRKAFTLPDAAEPRLFRQPGGDVIGYSWGIWRWDGTRWLGVNALDSFEVNALVLATGNRMIAGADKGLMLSQDGGITWTTCNRGIRAASTLALAALGDTVVVQTRGAVHLSRDAGRSWRLIDRSSVVSELSRVSVAPNGTIYSSHIVIRDNQRYTQLKISGDLGESWSPCTPPTTLPGQTIVQVIATDSIVMSRSEHGYLYVSFNRGTSWKRIWIGNTGAQTCAIDSYGAILASGGQTFFRTLDTGVTWMTLSHNESPYAIHAGVGHDYFALANFSIHRSKDLLPFRQLVHPHYGAGRGGLAIDGQGGFTLAGISVVRSTDEGQSWEAFTEGLDRSYMIPICATGSRRLYVGSIDAGIYTREVPLGPAAVGDGADGASVGGSLISCVSASRNRITLTAAAEVSVAASIYDMLGNRLASAGRRSLRSGRCELPIDVGLSPGAYAVRLTVDDRCVTTALVTVQ